MRAFRRPFSLYQINKIPLLAPHSDFYYSELAVKFEALVFNRDNSYFAVNSKMSDVSTDPNQSIHQTFGIFVMLVLRYFRVHVLLVVVR